MSGFGRDGHRDACGCAFSVVERVLRRSVGLCVSGYPELLSYPGGFAILLHLDFDLPVVTDFVLLARQLGNARGVLRLAVCAVAGEVVLLASLYFGTIVNWRVVVASALFIRLVPGGYSPENRAVMAIGSPVATMLVGLAVEPLLHFTNW